MQIAPYNNNPLSRLFYDNHPKEHSKQNQKTEDRLSASINELDLHREVLDFSYKQNNQRLAGHIKHLSFNASFRFDNQLINIQVEVEKQVLQMGSSQSSEDLKDDLLNALPEELREKVEGYLEEDSFPNFLSADVVSQNIFNFSLSHYNKFLNSRIDEKPLREDFLSHIQPAVEQGFNEALEMLDSFLTDDVRDLILETRNLTQDKFNNFLEFDVAA